MNIEETHHLTKLQQEQIVKLWNQEYPTSIRLESTTVFDIYLSSLITPRHLLLTDNQGDIKGWYMDFIREEEWNFAMIVDGALHGQGYGTQLLNHGKKQHQRLRGWVVTSGDYLKANGGIYRSPVGFYLKNGFRFYPDIRYDTPTLQAVRIVWERADH